MNRTFNKFISVLLLVEGAHLLWQGSLTGVYGSDKLA